MILNDKYVSLSKNKQTKSLVMIRKVYNFMLKEFKIHCSMKYDISIFQMFNLNGKNLKKKVTSK